MYPSLRKILPCTGATTATWSFERRDGVINKLPTLEGLLEVTVIAENLEDVSCLACVYTCRIWDIRQWCVDPAGETCSVP